MGSNAKAVGTATPSERNSPRKNALRLKIPNPVLPAAENADLVVDDGNRGGCAALRRQGNGSVDLTLAIQPR